MKKTTITILKMISLSAIIIVCSNVLSAKSMPFNMTKSLNNRQLITSIQNKSGLYGLDSVRTIYLKFPQSNWWNLLTANYSKKIDLPATLIYGGKTYDSVGVRFRGQTSYQKVNTKKKSFNISLEYIKDNQKIDGYKTLNLNNGFEDPSFMNEALYTALAGQNIPTVSANFIRLVINDEDWGLYSNVQQINNDFFEEWFVDASGSYWRAEYPDTSTARKQPPEVKPPMMNIFKADYDRLLFAEPPGPGGNNFGAGECSLNYLGDDPITYTRYYTLKSDVKENTWESLAIACKKLDKLSSVNLYDSLKYYLDVDRSLWHLANEIVFADDDGYVNKGGMDYYVFLEDKSERITPIDFDGNSTFTAKNVTWDPFLKISDKKYPLLNKILADPSLKQRYIAHVRSILENLLTEDAAIRLINEYDSLIKNHVSTDPKKLYSVVQYNAAIESLKKFITNRKVNIQKNINFQQIAPEILTVDYFSSNGINVNPNKSEKITVKANITSQNGIKSVKLYYGEGLSGLFNYIEMYDDGQHADENSNDGIFASEIPNFPIGSYVRFYVEAVANNTHNTASYSPEGAEHDVFFYYINAETSISSDIVINEIMASNKTVILDPQGDADDWIELFNVGDAKVNLIGMYLTDKLDALKKWQFSESTILSPGEYVLVWADEDSKDNPDGIHTNFKLSTDGEQILLIDRDDKGNMILDSISFPNQMQDVSWGRLPNGNGEFQFLIPTPNSRNQYPNSITNDNDDSELNVFPNPTKNALSIQLQVDKPNYITLKIFNSEGLTIKVINEGSLQQGNYLFTWDGNDNYGKKCNSGTYYISVHSQDINEIKKIIYLK